MFNLSKFFKKTVEVKERSNVVTEALKAQISGVSEAAHHKQ